MGCALRKVVATLVGLGLFVTVGQISSAADTNAPPMVHVRYLSGETELDPLRLGANFFSDLPIPFSQIPQEASGLMFTCRPHHISQPVDIFAPAGATVFLLVDSSDNDAETDRCPQLLSRLADGGWVSAGEAQRGSGGGLRRIAVLKKTFGADSHFTVSGGAFSGILVAAKSLAVDPTFASSHRKVDGRAISTQPSVTNEPITSAASPATQPPLANSASAVPSTGSTISAAQATTMPSGTSPAALEADSQYAHASKLASDNYDATMASAGQTYLKNLNASLDAALAQKNLDEANQIDAKIRWLREDPRTRRPMTTQPHPEAAAQLPEAIAPEMLQQFAGRIRLTSALGGTKWLGMSGDQKIVALDADGDGGTSAGENITWVAISDDQILVFWPKGRVDMWTFDANHEHLVQRWVGSKLKDENNSVEGHRVP
jgi:hypothetical protein